MTQATSIRGETLEFLQRRVAAFGRMVTAIGLFWLLVRLALGASAGSLASDLKDPTVYLLVAATLSFAATWWLCSSRPRSRGFVQAVEFLGLLTGSALIGLIGLLLPVEHRPQLVVVLLLSYIVIVRAIYVPSQAPRTFKLCLAIGLPLVAMTYRVFAGLPPAVTSALLLPGWQLADWSSAQLATLHSAAVAAWWSVTTLIATAASTVIYGLRRDVSEARKLGQYNLGERLGQGGMGTVYRAWHCMLRRPTALKLLPPEGAGEQAIARFEREVQHTAQLSHPNIVTIFDYGRTPDGQFYYAMELLDGAGLDEIVELDGPQPPARVAHIVHDVAGALAEAHRVGLIHRDVKPANVILCNQGSLPDVAKVVDFGLLKDINPGADPGLTAPDTLRGTPLYMSPEQISDPDTVDERSDLYALGAVGYFLLTGQHVFTGNNLLEVCGHHLHSEPEPPAARLGQALPEDLTGLLLRCLHKQPGKRPEDAGTVRRLARACACYDEWDVEQARDWWEERGVSVRRHRHERLGTTGSTRPTVLTRALSPGLTA